MKFPWCQFHQQWTYKFFVQTLFWQLFSSYMYIVKDAEMTFVQKFWTFNIDEIDTSRQFHQHFLCAFFVIMSFLAAFLAMFWLWRQNSSKKHARKCWWNWHQIDLSNVGWNIRSVLEPDAHVAWGDWGKLALCPNMTYAYGFSLKVRFKHETKISSFLYNSMA